MTLEEHKKAAKHFEEFSGSVAKQFGLTKEDLKQMVKQKHRH
ncbi:MAG: hypothetical protein ACRC68_09515 [Clostridium sp.]